MKATPEFFDSGVPRSESEIVAHLFAQAMQRLNAMVLKPTGMKQSSRDFRQARAAELGEQVDRILSRLNRATADWIGSRMPEVVKQAIARANTQAVDAGVRREDVVKGSFSLIDEETVVIFARDIGTDLNKAAASMGERAKTILRATAQVGLSETDINTIIAGGVIEGMPRQTYRALADALQAVHGERVTITGKDGVDRDYKVGDYAEMVVRTRTREATVTARHNRLEALGLDVVVIIGRISKYPCTAFLGQAFSLSGKHPKYPPYASLPDGGPPFHPNCSKGTRPFVEDLATGAQLRAAEPDEDVGKLLGKPFGQIGRAYKDLQLEAAVKGRYGTTEKKLYAA
jgi:BMFP domain-containing protein YqiC